MDINILDYLTFRNVILAIFCLPLATMLLTIPFLGVIPKGVKNFINNFGYVSAFITIVIVIELIYRTIGSIIDFKYQEPKMIFDFDKGITNRYEPFDSGPLIYLIVFLIIAAASWVISDIYATKMKYGDSGKPYSEKNPLNLSE